MADTGTQTSRPNTPTRFRKASVVGEWYKAWRGHIRRDAITLDMAAKLLERELRNAKGIDRATRFIKAKRATWALYRASAHADACAMREIFPVFADHRYFLPQLN